MGAVCLLLAASLALGVMELGTGGSAASIQEAASVESAQGEEESETEAGVSQAALREEAALFGGFLRRGERSRGELPRGCGLCRLLL